MMADWREGSDPKPVRKAVPGKPHVNAPDPVAKPAPSAPAPAPKDWRGRTSRPTSSSPQTSKEWMRAEHAPVVIRGVRRRVFLLIAAIAIPILSIAYINYLFRSPKRLPLLVGAPVVYTASELSEYPYANRAADSFRKTNPDSIRLPKDENASAQLLNDILFNDDWTRKYLSEEFPRNKDKLLGGGPDARVVSIYLSGFVSTQRDGDQIKVGLVSPGGNPFADGMSDRNSVVDIGQVLERILKSVDNSAVAWVTLDVRPAPIIANFGDMHVPLKQYLKSWFDKRDKAEQDRLVITLPGEDYEENWVSPELSSTVLAHVYRMCLSGEYDSQGFVFNAITLAEAEQQISDKVAEWVRNRYFAIQKPQWIYSERTQSAAQRLKLISLVNPPKLSVSKTDSLSFAAERWNQLTELKAPYRFAPVELGILEAQLVQLLESVEAGAGLAELKSRLDIAMRDLQRSRPVPQHISLIEDRLVAEYSEADDSRSKLFANRYALWQSQTPWTKADSNAGADNAGNTQPNNSSANTGNANKSNSSAGNSSASNAGADKGEPDAAGQTAATPSPGQATGAGNALEDLTGDQRAQFVVYAFRRMAADNGNPELFFNQKALQWNIDSCGPASKWLELQFLNMLAVEVDWRADQIESTERSRACASVWRTFCDLQELSSNPRPELAWWLRTEIQQVDLQLHKAVDLLIGEEFALASTTCGNAQDGVNNLSQKSQLLSQAFDLRDEIFWSTPHLLRWYLHRYRFDNSPAVLEKEMAQLGELIALTHKLSLSLKPALTEDTIRAFNPAKTHEIFQLSQDLSERFQRIKDSRSKKIKELSGLPKPNPQTIRELRIALRTPFLDPETRRNFGRALEEYYTQTFKDDASERLDNGVANTKIEQQKDLSPAIEGFLAPLQAQASDSYRAYFRTMLTGDQRFSPLPAKPRSPENSQILDQLYLESIEARQLAFSYGSHPSNWQARNQNYPWSAPAEFLLVSQARYRQIQAERLAAAAWGNGEIFSSTAATELYFYKLGTKYTQATSTNTLASSLLAQAGRKLDQAAERVLNIQLNFQGGSDTVRKNAKAHSIDFRIGASNKALSPTVYVGRDRTAAVINTPLRCQFYEEPSQDQDFAFSADADQIENQLLVLAFRGHYRSHELKVESTRPLEKIAIDFERTEPRVPSLKVVHNSSQKTKVIVMLDCSDSMNQFKVTNREGQVVPAFVEAKRVTAEIIEALQSVHGSHNLEVGLVLFGALIHDDEMSMLKAENMQIRCSPVRPLDADRKYADTLIALINELDPSRNEYVVLGCTPLYDALHRANEMVEGVNSLIYVVSDGYNEYTQYKKIDGKNVVYYDGKMRNATQVKGVLRDQNILRIYQFKDPLTQPDEVAKQEELRSLIGKRGKFSQAGSFAELEKQIKSDLPQSKVVILNARNERMGNRDYAFGEEIQIDVKQDDLPLRVKVKASLSDITSNATRENSREQIVHLVGSESLIFEFRENSNRLVPLVPAADAVAMRKVIKLPLESLSADMSSQPDEKLQSVDVLLSPIHNRARKESDQDQLSFEVRLQEQSNLHCTPRPVHVLGRLAARGQLREQDFLIADFEMDRSHYPVIELPIYPWMADKRKRPVQANLTLWMAFQSVDFKNKITLMDGDEKNFGTVTLKRSQQTIVVSLPADSKRLFVVCDKASLRQRVFDRPNRTETHTFQLYPSTKQQPVTVELIEPEELNSKNFEKLEFDAISLSDSP